ncbi:hypothetical protein EVAR_76064_1 [Eumeta japonica]|uniref:Uncharacterized protein n=1 Tax=Eumeta variegata TaxID=151549 RepID=A0A4C1W5G8_EUMVA|nr:hypothetical protein EVAR_76064_1 [Eumeta japonica]
MMKLISQHAEIPQDSNDIQKPVQYFLNYVVAQLIKIEYRGWNAIGPESGSQGLDSDRNENQDGHGIMVDSVLSVT